MQKKPKGTHAIVRQRIATPSRLVDGTGRVFRRCCFADWFDLVHRLPTSFQAAHVEREYAIAFALKLGFNPDRSSRIKLSNKPLAVISIKQRVLEANIARA